MNIVSELYLFRLFICVIIMLFHFFLYLLTFSKAHLIMLHEKLQLINCNCNCKTVSMFVKGNKNFAPIK